MCLFAVLFLMQCFIFGYLYLLTAAENILHTKALENHNDDDDDDNNYDDYDDDGEDYDDDDDDDKLRFVSGNQNVGTYAFTH